LEEETSRRLVTARGSGASEDEQFARVVGRPVRLGDFDASGAKGRVADRRQLDGLEVVDAVAGRAWRERRKGRSSARASTDLRLEARASPSVWLEGRNQPLADCHFSLEPRLGVIAGIARGGLLDGEAAPHAL
jgi:hypothetical protein